MLIQFSSNRRTVSIIPVEDVQDDNLDIDDESCATSYVSSSDESTSAEETTSIVGCHEVCCITTYTKLSAS